MGFEDASILYSERSRPVWLAVGAVAGTEALMAVHVAPAVIASGVVTVAIAGHLLFGGAARRWGDIPATDERTAMAALALVPIARLLGMAMPFADLPRWTDPLLIALPLMAGVLLVARNAGAMGTVLGLRCPTPWFWQLGVAGGGAVLAALIATGVLPVVGVGAVDRPTSSDAALVLGAVSLSALVDEFLYRGILQGTLGVALGQRVAMWVVVVLYVCASAGHRTPVAVVAFAVVGGYLGWCRLRTGCVLGGAVAHVLISLAVVYS